MQENILHFIWQHQYFKVAKAKTSDGEYIQVFKQGIYNTNAGPDFEEAKVLIGDVEWNGDIEIHVKSSDWATHKHQHDKSYNKVVLHVVWENDKKITREDQTLIPTLELKVLVDAHLISKIESLINSIEPIPCASQINLVPDLTVIETIHKSLIKRLERKSELVLDELKTAKGDWSETAYRLLMRQMGMKVNGELFYELAKSVPYHLIRKYKHSITSIEALLFGTSGFLFSSKESEYILELRKEYTFLKNKHHLVKQFEPHHWKFMRLRPSNFPTLRIAQAASILTTSSDIFEWLTEFSITKEVQNRLKVNTSIYWHTHYRFTLKENKKVPSLGKSSIDLILLNVVSPLLAAYSIYNTDDNYMTRAVNLMEGLKPEQNRIIKKWQQLSINPINGAESQGLIELYNEECMHKKCLSCAIGFKLLNKG